MVLCPWSTAQPTLVSSVLNDYIGTMVPDFPAPAYGNKKDNFYM
jgi:hypothetical protein